MAKKKATKSSAEWTLLEAAKDGLETLIEIEPLALTCFGKAGERDVKKKIKILQRAIRKAHKAWHLGRW
jgi:hypothetical protein